jgi:hypothetical protein
LAAILQRTAKQEHPMKKKIALNVQVRPLAASIIQK